MDTLSSARTLALLQQLQSALPKSSAEASARPAIQQTEKPAQTNNQAHLKQGAASLQVPAALRQIIAQAQSPELLLKQLNNLQNSSELTAAQRQWLTQLLQTAFTAQTNTPLSPALVNAWFGFNPVTALLAGTQNTTTAHSPFWLQQALPLFLLALQKQGQSPLSPQLTALLQHNMSWFNELGRSSFFTRQLLHELQGALQQVRLSQILYADTASRQEPDYYLTLPWQGQGDVYLIELLLQKRRPPKEQTEQTELWVLSLRLPIAQIGPVLARARWNGEQAAIKLYTDNDNASDWLRGKVSRLQKQLETRKIPVAHLHVQTGRIPATLAPDPNQLIRVVI